MRIWCRGYLSRAIGIAGLCLIVAGAFVLREWDASQRREIERLSTTCPPAQAGERLAATVQQECGNENAELRCVYISTAGYGRPSRSRPAVPKGAS